MSPATHARYLPDGPTEMPQAADIWPWAAHPGFYNMACAGCGLVGTLYPPDQDGHTVTVHDDGTVTISPSLLCGREDRCGAHYFVERSVVRWT